MTEDDYDLIVHTSYDDVGYDLDGEIPPVEAFCVAAAIGICGLGGVGLIVGFIVRRIWG
jgi:hypothetical protein